MISLFNYEDYKLWVNDIIAQMPNGGRGQYRKIASILSISPTIITQVFRGSRDLTPEQALVIGDYFGLTHFESKYFLLLVNYARAGSHLYQNVLKSEIIELQKQSMELNNRLTDSEQLTSEAKATLYSNWYYLAIWSLTAISGFNDLETISEKLNLERKVVKGVLDFLIRYGLVRLDDNQKFTVGPTHVHLESTSPHISRHHQNWRLKAFQKYERSSENDIFYTAPVTLSKTDAQLLREEIIKFISKTTEQIQKSPSEELYCFCLDWFQF